MQRNRKKTDVDKPQKGLGSSRTEETSYLGVREMIAPIDYQCGYDSEYRLRR